MKTTTVSTHQSVRSSAFGAAPIRRSPLALLTAFLRPAAGRSCSPFSPGRASGLVLAALTAATVLGQTVAERTIETVAGGGSSLGDGGAATAAQLNTPWGVALDGSGNLYIADQSTHRIRKVDASGTITTVAGTGNRHSTGGFGGDGGPAVQAQLNSPRGVAVDGAGNLYFSDSWNERIRKVDASGTITTVAGTGAIGLSGDGGRAVQARLHRPRGVALDGSGNLYIADSLNHRIRKVDTSGTITTVAGTGAIGLSGDGGPAVQARLRFPIGVAVDGSGNLYIADAYNHRIRKVDTSGTITTVAGAGAVGRTMGGFGGDGGPAVQARLNRPFGVAVDGSGNLYIADAENDRIRKVDTSGTITTVAGTGARGFAGDDGAATAAQFDEPIGVAVDGSGNLYIADAENDRIRLLTAPPSDAAEPTPTGEPQPPDNDSDGFPDSVEWGAPNHGDGNGDGVPDAQQPRVVSFPNAANARYVTLEVAEPICISYISTKRRPRRAEPLPASSEFPIGFLDFGLCGMSSGGAASATLHLPERAEFNRYWKYGPTPGNPAAHWYEFDYDGETGAQFLETGEIVLHFIDGGRGDDDLRSNGRITGWGAPALTIPSLAPLTLDMFGGETPVGLAVRNPTDAANALVLSLTGADGVTEALKSRVLLEAKGQLNSVLCALIDCGMASGPAVLIARGRQGPLESFFLAGDVEGKKLDAVAGEFKTSRRLYFPLVKQGGQGATVFFVSNPTLQETNVRFTLYREKGEFAQLATRTVAGGGFVMETAEGLFGDTGGSGPSYVEAEAGSSLWGFSFLEEGESFSALAAQTSQEVPEGGLYAPHFLTGPISGTELSLLSLLEHHATQVRVQAFDNDGVLIAEAERELSREAGLLLSVGVGELLPLDTSTQPRGLMEGYLKLDFSVTSGPLLPISSPRVVGAVTLANGGGRTVLPLAAAGGKLSATFLHVAHGPLESDPITALSILNPGLETVTVTLRAFDRKGQTSAAERTLEIAPGSRRIGLLDLFFGTQFAQQGGRMEVVSDRPVISFAVFGDRDLQFLSAIPSPAGSR